MADQIAHFHIGRTSLQDICTDVGDEPALDQHKSLSAARVSGKFPCRPSFDVLSGSIPLFFIARNRVGFWIAREVEGRTGGIFPSENRRYVLLRQVVEQAVAQPCFSQTAWS